MYLYLCTYTYYIKFEHALVCNASDLIIVENSRYVRKYPSNNLMKHLTMYFDRYNILAKI